ncbi:CGNR zinc finger domain-containing protein [Streptomyces sp. NPDC089919]|uniref:CGNR zinc finger domain-containing protein n=1 Tax=Streptomyces sp. NPDC089919 TaxID=3155188 RepID=UPI00343ED02F
MDVAERTPAARGPAPGEAQYASLALVNTEFELPTGPYDGLPDAPAARGWLTTAGLVPARTRVDADGAERLRLLRTSVREAFAARIEERPPAADALAHINTALDGAPGVRKLSWTARGPAVEVRRRADAPLETALTVLAEDAVELLAGPVGAKLSACGAQGCTRLFVRAHASRRWCSDRCGNRVRAVRHYADRTRRPK